MSSEDQIKQQLTANGVPDHIAEDAAFAISIGLGAADSPAVENAYRCIAQGEPDQEDDNAVY